MTTGERTCKALGCDKQGNERGAARGLCVTHYSEWQRTRPHKQCLVPDCELSANWPGSGRGYCSKHLYRVRRHGSPTEGGRLRNGLSLAARIALKTKVDRATGCHLWQDKLDKNGYGHICIDHDSVPAHRAAWVAVNGPIPKGMHIDHLCEVHACVNPYHLEPVTNAENARRIWHRPPEKRIAGIEYKPRMTKSRAA